MPEFNKAFHAWFQGSKVVDSHGQPLVVYHGTLDNFSAFSADIVPFRGGLLAFASESPEFASMYAMRGEEYNEGSAVMPVYLSIQRPFDYRKHWKVAADYYEIGGGPADSWELNRLAAEYYRVYEENLTDSQREQYGATQFVKQVKSGSWLPLEIPSFVRYVHSLGFDGIRMREMRSITWAVFEPEQIKSAIGNDGTWDADDPDIRSNPVPETFWGRAGAGILLHCADDDTYLLTLRSGDVEQPGTWGIPGGACSGEGFYTGAEGRAVSKKQAWECAVRETLEELGWLPKHPGAVQPVVFKRGNFRYTTFVVEVSGEEKAASRGISLNWENDDFSWLTPDDLSAMSNELHFGALFVLDKLGVTRA